MTTVPTSRGRGAPDTLIRLLDRPGGAATLITQYESARDTECTTYLIDRGHYYNAVRRYPTPFWYRRKHDAAA